MKPAILPRLLIIFTCSLLCGGCQKREDFATALVSEIGILGGNTNVFREMPQTQGSWKIKKDLFGVAIDTDGITFDDVSNILTKAYGPPVFYSAANKRHGPTYIYSSTNTGISIFISATTSGAELSLTRILKNP